MELLDYRGAKTSGNSGELDLDKLKIADGQVAVTNEVTKEPRTVYDHIDLKLSDFGPKKEFGIDAAVHFPGPGKELLSFNGKAGPLEGGNTAALPLNGRFSLQEVSLAGVNRFSPGIIPAQTDSVASGEGTVSSTNELMALKGNLKLDNTVIHGSKLDYPIEAQYDLSDDRKQDKIQVRSGVVKLGSTSFAVSGDVNAATNPSQLNLRLTTNNSSISEIARLAGAFGAAFTPGYQVKGTINADVTATGAANAPQLNGSFSASGVFGGQENGTVAVDMRPVHPLCSVKIKLSGVDTNALLSAVSTMKDTLYGSLAADTDLTFTLQPGGEVARTLNGTLNFNVTNGQLKNVNILNELSRVAKFLNSAPTQSGSGTALRHFSGTLDIVNGVANTNNLAATLDAAALSATGSLNLVNEALNMRMNAVLGSGPSQAVGGTHVGGFLNTVLANNQGELVVPVTVTGTMAHPVFTPDMAAIAKMRLSNLLPTSGDPSKLTSGLVGSVLGNKGAGGILGGILGNGRRKKANNSRRIRWAGCCSSSGKRSSSTKRRIGSVTGRAAWQSDCHGGRAAPTGSAANLRPHRDKRAYRQNWPRCR